MVIENPFGHDLESARQLNVLVESVFPQDAVFRIDHYLGKETVQNVLAPRYVNQLFEPLRNANKVDHVQITVARISAPGAVPVITTAWVLPAISHPFGAGAVRRRLARRRGGPRVPGGGSIPAESTIETYAAIRVFINTRRFVGRAVLPARRQAAGPACDGNRGGVQARRKPAVPGPQRRRGEIYNHGLLQVRPSRASSSSAEAGLQLPGV